MVVPGQLEDPPVHSGEISRWEPGESWAWNETLTQDLINQIVSAARVGGTKRTTALACGVRPDQLEWWLDEGMRVDGPPLMQQLSARFLSTQEGANLALVEVVQHAARLGDWEAALALLERRDPFWRKSEKHIERDNAPAELSQSQKYDLLVASLGSPKGDLRRAMVEAGHSVPEEEEESVDPTIDAPSEQ